MRNITEMPPAQDGRGMELRRLQVTAYCCVGADLAAQTGRIDQYDEEADIYG